MKRQAELVLQRGMLHGAPHSSEAMRAAPAQWKIEGLCNCICMHVHRLYGISN